MSGWQSSFADVAEQQPIGTAKLRAQALRRWNSMPRYIDNEIASLRRGLGAHYSAPQSLVRRVIAQMDELSSEPVEKSPFYSPASRDTEVAFRDAFRRLIRDKINPALYRYRDFLSQDYLPHAGEGVAVSDLPDGIACYQALLRAFTTLNCTPQEVYDLGLRTVATNQADIVSLGQALFGTSGFGRIIDMSKARAENHFQSKDELLQFSRSIMLKAKTMTATLVDGLPAHDPIVEPERDFEDAAGASSHYDPNPDITKPGIYRIELGSWPAKLRARH